MEHLASSLPDFGQPETPTAIGGFGAFIGGCLMYWQRGTFEAAERGAFTGGLVGFGFGLCAYLFGLLTGLY